MQRVTSGTRRNVHLPFKLLSYYDCHLRMEVFRSSAFIVVIWPGHSRRRRYIFLKVEVQPVVYNQSQVFYRSLGFDPCAANGYSIFSTIFRSLIKTASVLLAASVKPASSSHAPKFWIAAFVVFSSSVSCSCDEALVIEIEIHHYTVTHTITGIIDITVLSFSCYIYFVAKWH